MQRIIVTGAKGFIGQHLVTKLRTMGKFVVEVDKKIPDTQFGYVDLSKKGLEDIIKSRNIDTVFHLAAKGGVHESTTNPKPYISDNIDGFWNTISSASDGKVKNFIYASSSSIETTSHINFYGGTKKHNEKLGNYFNKSTDMNVWGIRYFSVYGPGGRPDMAIPIFIDKILNEEEIILYGNPSRYLTYVDDIVEATISVITRNCGVYNAYHNQLVNFDCEVIPTLRMMLQKKPKVTYEWPRVYEKEQKIGPYQNLINQDNAIDFKEGLQLILREMKCI